jgi:hypothetical protein
VRRAICFGIPGFTVPRSADRSAEDDEKLALRPLPFAPQLAREMSEALTRLGYESVVHDGPVLPTEGVVDIIRQAIEEAQGGVVVVHLITHGRTADRSGALHFAGSDGRFDVFGSAVGDLVRHAEDRTRGPLALFLLDLCQAGNAARLPWQVASREDAPRAWVIAACAPDEAAYNGRFSRALITTLEQVDRGELHIDPALRSIPLATVAQAARREVHRLAVSAGGRLQQVTGSLIDIAADPDLPFFPNRTHEPRGLRLNRPVQQRRRPDLDAMVADLDESVDLRHHLDSAVGPTLSSGFPAQHAPSGNFTGGERELRRLSFWLDEQGQGSIAVVTGSPGAGKSALLGILVCACHPSLRRLTRHVWEHVRSVPPRIDDKLAVVHARQLNLAALCAAISRQLGVGETRSPERLIEFVSELASQVRPPVIILDSLDEAEGGVDIVERLILPLVSRRQAEDMSSARILVGSRRYEEFSGIFSAAADEGVIVDLDAVPAHVLEDDLHEYVAKLLRATSHYRHRGDVVGAFATETARALAARPADGSSRAWGEFLVAGLYTRHFASTYDREPVADPAAAKRLGAGVPRTLPEVFELDVAAGRNGPSLRSLLAALAFAYGTGMPASVLARMAGGLAGSGFGLDASNVTRLLDAGRFYIRQSTDSDGALLYRLFHQGLIDYLKTTSAGSADSNYGRPDPAAILDALLAPLGPANARDRGAAEPYVMRNVLTYAVQGRRVGEILSDPEFMLHADHTSVAAALNAQAGAAFAATMSAYARVESADRAPLDERRRAFALAAVREGLDDLAARLARPPALLPLAWQPRWCLGASAPIGACGRHSTPAEPPQADRVMRGVRRFGRRLPAVTAVGCTTIDGVPVAAIGGADGVLQLWDLTTNRLIGPPSKGHQGEIKALQCWRDIHRQPIVVTTGSDGMVLRGT